MIQRLLLPVGLIMTLVAALLVPGAGLRLANPHTAFAIIASIFLINGYQTDFRAFAMDRRLAGAFLIAALVSFGGGSLLGKAVVSLLWFDAQIATGILVMCAMAPTLSSVIVITKESGGNTLWAIVITLGLNLLAIFAIPLQLKFVLDGTEVSLPCTRLVMDLIWSILTPFVIGGILRRLIRRPPSRLVNLLPTLLVILLSYISFCSGRKTLVSTHPGSVLATVAAVLGIHLVLLILAVGTARIFGYGVPERKAVAFLSSQKTLPTAIGILASLGNAGGAAALPCVIFHFTQILADSVISAAWRPSDSESLSGPECPEISEATAETQLEE